MLRFDRAERVVHWVNATLFAIVMATAMMLYIPPISAAIGRRELVVTVHVYAGLLLPFPLLLGAFGRRWGRRLRADLRQINHWIPEDKVWFRRRGWRAERVRDLKQGKFNAGQKLNAAFTGGAILVMLATGSIMHWFNHFPLSWRTGATFVHDWIFIALFFTITGHVMFAVADKEAMNSMLTGTISRNWAKRHAPRWLEEEKAAAEAVGAKAAAPRPKSPMPATNGPVATRKPVVPTPEAVVSAPEVAGVSALEVAVVPSPVSVSPTPVAIVPTAAAVVPIPTAVVSSPEPSATSQVPVVPNHVAVVSTAAPAVPTTDAAVLAEADGTPDMAAPIVDSAAPTTGRRRSVPPDPDL